MRRCVYVLLAANLCVAVGLVLAGGFTIGPSIAFAMFSPLPAIVGGRWLQRRGHLRIGEFLECFGCLACLSITTMLVIIPLCASDAPFADPMLAAADSFLGLHYRAAVDLLLPIAPLLKASYATFQVQMCLVPAALFYFRMEERAWRLLFLIGITLAVTDSFFPFFPARGPAVFFGLPRSLETELGDLSWHAPAVIEAVRSGTRHIDRWMLTGLISFPSFHAAAALLFTWALWPIRHLRWLGAGVNVTMCVAAVVIGDHYFIDIVAGLGAAALIILLHAAVGSPLIRSHPAGGTAVATP